MVEEYHRLPWKYINKADKTFFQYRNFLDRADPSFRILGKKLSINVRVLKKTLEQVQTKS